MSQQIGCAAVDGFLRDNMIARLGKCFNSIGNCRGAGSDGKSGGAPFQGGDAFLYAENHSLGEWFKGRLMPMMKE